MLNFAGPYCYVEPELNSFGASSSLILRKLKTLKILLPLWFYTACLVVGEIPSVDNGRSWLSCLYCFCAVAGFLVVYCVCAIVCAHSPEL